MKAGARRVDLAGLWFVLPFVLLYTALLIVPLLRGVSLSFHRADLFGNRVFVGFENYARFLADPIFWQSVGNTFLLVLMVVHIFQVVYFMVR